MEEQFVPKPESNMILALFTTICCCQPLGIIAVVKASNVDALYSLKQYEAAQKSADEAKKWSLIGICLCAVFCVLYAIFLFVASLMGRL